MATGAQLAHPSGFAGSLAGHLMAIANLESNQIAIRALQISSGESVLELGVGPGCAIHMLSSASTCGRIFGIDHSATMLAQALRRNRHAIAHGRVHLTLGRLDILPYQNESIDKVLVVHVAYFFNKDAVEIREARRVLQPGGRMAILVTEKLTLARWRFTKFSTHRVFNRTELISLLSRGGFSLNEITVSPITLSFGIHGLLAVVTKTPADAAQQMLQGAIADCRCT